MFYTYITFDWLSFEPHLNPSIIFATKPRHMQTLLKLCKFAEANGSQHFPFLSTEKQDKKCTYNVTSRRVRVTIVARE